MCYIIHFFKCLLYKRNFLLRNEFSSSPLLFLAHTKFVTPGRCKLPDALYCLRASLVWDRFSLAIMSIFVLLIDFALYYLSARTYTARHYVAYASVIFVDLKICWLEGVFEAFYDAFSGNLSSNNLSYGRYKY